MKTKLLNVSSLNVIELDILKLDTHVRLKELNYYSTHTVLLSILNLNIYVIKHLNYFKI